MPQVLEAPEILDEEEFIAVEDRPVLSPETATVETEKTHQPITLLRSILSVFTGPKPEDIPEEYDGILQRHETPIDHLCRTDPYFCMKALSG